MSDQPQAASPGQPSFTTIPGGPDIAPLLLLAMFMAASLGREYHTFVVAMFTVAAITAAAMLVYLAGAIIKRAVATLSNDVKTLRIVRSQGRAGGGVIAADAMAVVWAASGPFDGMVDAVATTSAAVTLAMFTMIILRLHMPDPIEALPARPPAT